MSTHIARTFLSLSVATALVVASPVRLTGQVTTLTPAAILVDSARVEIDAAVLANDNARLDRSIMLLDRALTTFPDDAYLLHYRGYANYRRVVTMFRSNKRDGVDGLITGAVADLQLSSSKLHWAETFSLMSSLLAIRIGLNPALGAELGMEVGELSGEAAKLDANNPRVLLMLAYAAQNTPAEYGGGKEKARTLTQRAIAAFETEKPAPLAPTWGKAEADALLKTLSGNLQ